MGLSWSLVFHRLHVQDVLQHLLLRERCVELAHLFGSARHECLVDLFFERISQIRQCCALQEVGGRGAVLDAAPCARSDLGADECVVCVIF